MKNNQYYYSESEWDRLGCGPLPKERDISLHVRDFSVEQKTKIIAKGNPPIDNNVVKGYN
jgi:hypothetical protein